LTTFTRHLTAPLQASLAAAQAALQASPAGGDDEEWVLPAGTHTLVGPLSLGRAGRSLALRGPGAATCAVTVGTGTLQLTGGGAEVDGVAFAGDNLPSALVVTADSVRLAGVHVACQSAAACVALSITTSGAVELEDVEVTGARGGAASTGAGIAAGEARLTGVAVSQVEGGAGGAVAGLVVTASAVELTDVSIEELTAAGAAGAVGLELAGAARVDVAGLEVRGLAGAGAVGARLLQGPGDDSRVSAVDLDVSDVDGGAAAAAGVVAGAAGALRVRGFTVANIRGAAATGVLVLAGAGAELSTGQVSGVVGQAGGACGARAVATPAVGEVVVRDVAVERIAAAPVPTDSFPPRDADGGPLWQAWGAAAVDALASAVVGPLALPAPPAASSVAGLHVDAVVDELAPLLDVASPGAVRVEDGSVRVVSGAALQIDGGLRAALVRRIEAQAALQAGWMSADEMQLAEVTWDRHGGGIHFGPGELRVYDSIFSRVTGPPLDLDAETELAAALAVFATGAEPPLRELGPLPYVSPGPADLPAELLAGTLPPVAAGAAGDLRLAPGATVATAAVAIPGDDPGTEVSVGAYPPPRDPGCEPRDPLARPAPPAAAAPASLTLVDYRARDAKSLLAVMLERARVAMPAWTDRGPADFTSMLLEALADRLDQLAYQQERAVGEGFLADARLRRSVEDHARALDYPADPGLSASAMIRFRLDDDALDALVAERLAALGLPALPPGTDRLELVTGGGVLEMPAATLVANASAMEQSVVFTTDEPLPWFPALDQMALAADVQPGDTAARIAGVRPEIEVGRWLMLLAAPGEPGHVVRATTIATTVDSTLVGWDPRRPSPALFRAAADPDTGEGAAVVLGNVVPAQHGLPLSRVDTPPAGATGAGAQSDDDIDPAVAANAPPVDPISPEPFQATLLPWQQMLTPTIDGSVDRELRLPFYPVSVQVPGYPFPGELRQGAPSLGVSVEGDAWTLVDDLALRGPGDEVFVLRASPQTGEALRFGDGVNGSALPARDTALQIEMRVGRGKAGNVGASVLTRLLHIPRDAAATGPLGELWNRPMNDLRALIRADNPLPAVGGREPEGTEAIRYRAPFVGAEGLSAVTPADAVHLLGLLPEVAGASARVDNLGLRTVVRVTVLLRDDDTLDDDERLRRWALVRARLEQIRLLGFDVETVPPVWVPLDLDVVVDADPHAQADALKSAVEEAVAGSGGLLDPDVSGLGGDLHLADLYRAISGVGGVAAARVTRFRRLAQGAPERLDDGVIPIAVDEVAVVRGPDRSGANGLLTVTVCGGLR
jgi:hypothetical protein